MDGQEGMKPKTCIAVFSLQKSPLGDKRDFVNNPVTKGESSQENRPV